MNNYLKILNNLAIKYSMSGKFEESEKVNNVLFIVNEFFNDKIYNSIEPKGGFLPERFGNYLYKDFGTFFNANSTIFKKVNNCRDSNGDGSSIIDSNGFKLNINY